MNDKRRRFINIGIILVVRYNSGLIRHDIFLHQFNRLKKLDNFIYKRNKRRKQYDLELSNIPYFKKFSNIPDSFLNRVFVPDGNFFTEKRPFAYEKPTIKINTKGLLKKVKK